MKKLLLLLVSVTILFSTACSPANTNSQVSVNSQASVNNQVNTESKTGIDSQTKSDALEEGWNGIYKADSEYYILLYTDNNETLTFNVIKKDGNSISYPIQWINTVPIEDENTVDYSNEFFDDVDTLQITRNGNEITVTAGSTDTGSTLNNISGIYTKYKNVDSGQIGDDFEL